MRLVNKVSANSVDASVSFTGMPVFMEQFWGYSVQVIITGSITGTLTLQGSDDFTNILAHPDGSDVVNWTDITGSSQAITGAGHGIYNSNSCEFRWLRPVFTSSGGVGTMSINVEGKGN